MHVLIFSWEYPPRVVGKLAEHVNLLGMQLAKNNVEVDVVTYSDSVTGVSLDANGINVTRVANPVRTHVNLLTWILTLNQEVERAASNVYFQAGKGVDVIDVHDWHFIPAAVTLKNAVGLPFVYSVDSIEDHRSPGTNSPLNMAIRGIEWLGFFEASAVTAKSEYMQNEVVRVYKVPAQKIDVVPPTKETWIKDLIKIYRNAMRGEVKA